MMSKTTLSKVVIIGGGTAGWLTAAILAADRLNLSDFSITLLESPEQGPIGVGEGTWPSMRTTLQRIGVSETDFIRQCDVSFKQGSQFIGWQKGGSEHYYHPFSLPQDYAKLNLSQYVDYNHQSSFANAVSPQPLLCDKGLAPKQISTPEYAAVVNYGYHLDSVKFTAFLQQHSVTKLNVRHQVAKVVDINNDQQGNIESLLLSTGDVINGDLFVDCSGFSALLLGEHYQVPLQPQQNILFNDRALAVQVPYSDDNAYINSTTLATAQQAGWIWDIGLSSRRGVGYVYSSAHADVEQSELILQQYVAQSVGMEKAQSLSIRQLKINPGYRAKFWHKNCVAIGLSAGFIEPLEASALVLIEMSAKMLSEQFPADKSIMPIIAKRFNNKLLQQWQLIIEFLKLHYVLSQRAENYPDIGDYWRDHLNPNSIPDNLQELLELWRYRHPWHGDSDNDELFSPASFQYVLYGMGFETKSSHNQPVVSERQINAAFQQVRENTQQLSAVLDDNRQLLNKVYQYGFSKI